MMSCVFTPLIPPYSTVLSNTQQLLKYILPVVVVGIVLSAIGVVFTLWCILRGHKRKSREFPVDPTIHDKQKMDTPETASTNTNTLKPMPDEKGDVFRSMDATNHAYEELVSRGVRGKQGWALEIFHRRGHATLQ